MMKMKMKMKIVWVPYSRILRCWKPFFYVSGSVVSPKSSVKQIEISAKMDT